MRDFVRDPIVESISVHAPIERCWALSTRVELVRKTLGMKLVGGITSGNITANSRVVWRGWKFGLPTQHHTLITKFEPPHAHYIRFDGHEITKEAFFQDSQERGRFAFFAHDHRLREEMDGGPITELYDEVRFSLPFGVVGRFIAGRIMEPHIRKLARQRFAMIKRLAEGEGWREWV
jgi:ligand-binding SRPBCC domain-containing protein